MAEAPNYPSNSKMPDKRVQPDQVPSITSMPSENDPRVSSVVSAGVTQKQPSLGRRFKESFVGGETVGSVGDYVMFEVVVPTFKALVVEMFQTSVERFFYGEVVSRGPRSRRGPVDYSSRSATRVARPDPRDRKPSRETPASDAAQDYRDLEFESRADAELVVDRMVELVQDYGAVSVSNLYDLAGVTVRPNFQDNSWGWTDLVGVAIKGTPTRGYFIDLPTPVSLDR
jgi:hypothetical protein